MNEIALVSWLQGVGTFSFLGVLGFVVYRIFRKPPKPSAEVLALQKRLKELEDKQDRTTSALDGLRESYNKLAGEYAKLTLENLWLHSVLERQGIPVPPTPDYLKPHTDENGNIVISLRQGGVDISGNARVESRNDIVAGDYRIGGNRVSDK